MKLWCLWISMLCFLGCTDRINSQFIDPVSLQKAKFFYAYDPNILGFSKIILMKNGDDYDLVDFYLIKGIKIIRLDTLSPIISDKFDKANTTLRYEGKNYIMGDCEQKPCLVYHTNSSFVAYRLHEIEPSKMECVSRQFRLIDSLGVNCPKLRFNNPSERLEYYSKLRTNLMDGPKCQAEYDEIWQSDEYRIPQSETSEIYENCK